MKAVLSAAYYAGQDLSFHFAGVTNLRSVVKHRRQEQTKQRYAQHTGEYGDPGIRALLHHVAEDEARMVPAIKAMERSSQSGVNAGGTRFRAPLPLLYLCHGFQLAAKTPR